MPKAIWNDVVLADSDSTVIVEGNHYFPPESINEAYFTLSSQSSTCPWKGVAMYFDVEVNGKTNAAAAWTYREPTAAAHNIKDHMAFWNGVRVE